MLAQNFRTATDLGITDTEHGALTTVLGMLERDELVHGKYPMARMFRQPNEFNMAVTIGYAGKDGSCGTIGCICGWAYIVSNKVAFFDFIESNGADRDTAVDAMPANLQDLFGLNVGMGALYDRSPAQAAIALRSYLSTGEARWDEALAAGE